MSIISLAFVSVFSSSPFRVVLCSETAGEMATAVLTATVSFREETHEDWHEFEVLGGDEPKILVKKTSMQSERQISVDPKSLKALSLSASMRNNSFNLVLPPAISPPRDLDMPLPLPLQPVRTKFVSCSLPNSASTSPKHYSGVLKKSKNKEQDPLVRGAAAAFRRSKSCGEGRACAPSLDFDILIQRSKQGNRQTSFSSKAHSQKSSASSSFVSKTESSKSNRSLKSINSFEDGFKCSALCLYLPGFGKGKPVRSSRKDDSFTRTTTMASSTARTASMKDNNAVISARASLEKFECGSWSSSAMILEDNADTGGHFFDLPSELIKGGSGGNDQDEPVSAAFVFDKEPLENNEIKGVLKTSGSKSRRSTESPRHVRFSTSSPVSYPASPTSSITPRLLQASQDLTIFLEAQAA